jgi:hypothetical protein
MTKIGKIFNLLNLQHLFQIFTADNYPQNAHNHSIAVFQPLLDHSGFPLDGATES